MKNRVRSLLVLMLVLILTGCGNQGDQGDPIDDAQTESQQQASDQDQDQNQEQDQSADQAKDANQSDADQSDADSESNTGHDSVAQWINQQLSQMTVAEKIGQMVIVGIEGTELSDEAREMLADFHVGGMILFQKNITSAAQTVALINELKAANSGGIPLFFGVDQEGGIVSRMPAELQSTPAAQVIGQAGDRSFTHEIGSLIGEQLHAMGFNMNFAPVLDIHSNPHNTVIGSRAFGTAPEEVTVHGLSMMQGLRSQQVVPVVKHFPGHGDTKEDSHTTLPLVNKSLAELREFELIPFIEAFNLEADAVMIAHILLSQIDPEKPATLSKKLVTELLREALQYDGVVITDDMTMGAIHQYAEIGEAAVQAVNAGVDIIMVAHQQQQQIEVLTSLIKAVDDGVIAEQALDDSVQRILALKHKYQLSNEATPEADVEALNQKIKDSLARINE